MRVTGPPSVIKVDTYVEAALEETKLVKGTASRQRTPGHVAGTAVGVGHSRYVSHIPNWGHFKQRMASEHN